jgi:polysaccharide biosynthesis protein PslH
VREAQRSRPRLLFVSPRYLFPLDQGGKIRTANTLRGMKGGRFEIHLASPLPPGRADEAELAQVCDRFLPWPAPEISRARRLAATLDRLPIGVVADRSQAGQAVVERALAEAPDVLVADFPHSAVLLPDRLVAPSVMFTHNVEAEIFERHAGHARGIWRPVWQDQARKMRRFEGRALRRFTRVIAVSARDAAALRAQFDLDRVDAIDTGVDLDFLAYTPPPPAPEGGGLVAFTGTMSARANIDGVQFLMDEVWPRIVRDRPRAEAVIIGRDPPEGLQRAARERGLPWRFTGFVDDVRPFVREAHVSVIPLRVGSGTRIKAFESMALGRPVVSTGVGVEGLDVVPDRHLLLADDADAFAHAIVRLLADPALGAALAQAARSLLEERFSWSQVAAQFEAICEKAMSGA